MVSVPDLRHLSKPKCNPACARSQPQGAEPGGHRACKWFQGGGEGIRTSVQFGVQGLASELVKSPEYSCSSDILHSLLFRKQNSSSMASTCT